MKDLPEHLREPTAAGLQKQKLIRGLEVISKRM
jgi:hypothetical protein